MTKRYYYTCPIQAAYMAKEFDVIFEVNLVDVSGIDYTQKGKLKLYPSKMRGDIRDDAFVDNINKRSSKYNVYYAHELFKFGTLYIAKESEGIFNTTKGNWHILNGTPYLKEYKQIFMPEVENE